MAAAAILGAVASLVGPAIELGKCFQKQLNYLCCFQSNVKALDDAAKNLADAEADLQVRVDGAKRNGEQILNQVETWLAKAEETRINNTLAIRTPRIFNLRSRYSISRKAIKTAQSMNLLRDTCNFDHVSNPALPASMHHEGRPLTPLAPGGWIESRKKIEDDIIIAMRERNAYVIGLCGMGGVGKTTMAKQIMNRAKELDERLFDEVLLVAVGQRADLLQIQHGILDWLGLKLNEETLAPRAIRLRDRLHGGNRKLIVIDDVWERINLEELGIPCQSDSCTILLTSRDSRVLRQMNAQRVFTVENLSEEEAWSMFQENVGACLVDDPNLLPTARDVAKECKGLPLALVAVSRALKDQASKGIWSDALKQLQSSNPINIPGFIEEVYSPIRLSFDFLKSPHAKSLFFLCSCFPDDHQISLEYLALYGFGLGILGDDIDNLEEARNRINGLVDMLKSRFLILDGALWNKHHVKMHDVVRDVAIFIAKQENHAILDSTSLDWSKQNPHINDCNMLSVFQNQSQFDFPTGLVFPNLSYLCMHLSYKFAVSDNFFKGMQQLKVLSISWVSLGLTPQNMILLKNLCTLHLYQCNLETLSVVGELSSLEILCCNTCYPITELPVEIGRLQRLRILEVINCRSLKTIVPGVISSLGQLEELKIFHCFNGWESKDIKNKRSNASLSELQSLSKLTCLEIEIENWSLDAQVLQLSSKLEKYRIQVGRSPCEPAYSTRSHKKKLSVSLKMSTSLRNWIDVFARTAEYLYLNDSNGFDFSGNQNMRCLVLKDCRTVVKLMSSSSTDCKLSVFAVLEEMHLVSLPKFEEICNGPIPNGSNSFAKLKEISLANLDRLLHVWRRKNQNVILANLSILRISCCGKLHRVFSSSVVIRSLTQLRILEIENCESMEEVFWIEKDDGNSHSSCITFPKLNSLILKRLENLTYFCKGIDIIEFPQLFRLDIKYCPKLTSFGKASDHQNHVSSSGGHDSIHIFCNTKISFGRLTTLDIGGYMNISCLCHNSIFLRWGRDFANISNISYLWCHHIPHLFFAELEWLKVSNISNISNLFSYSVATNLVNLKALIIKGCDDIAYVIAAADDSTATTSEKNPLKIFHKLERLELNGLKSLTAFCKGIHDTNIEFRLPAELIIEDCPKLTSLINIQSDENDHVNSSSTHHPSLHLICYTKSIFGSLHHLVGDLKVLRIEGRVNDNSLSFPDSDSDSVAAHLVNLKTGCVNMNSLFSYTVAAHLVNLKTLYISSCEEMLYVIANDDAKTSETKQQQIIFHKLEELKLNDLPKLQNFCEGRWDIQLPSLKQLNIKNVGGFYSAGECVPLFCNTQSTFGSLYPLFCNLEELHIEGCVNINNLFSYSVAAHLVNLKTLDITCCDEMAYVVTEDDTAETSQTKPQQIILHKLEYLTLFDLPKLQNFCEGGWDLQLPSLVGLYIKNVGFYSAPECVPLLCHTQIIFDKLWKLYIEGNLGGDHIKHLFSYSVAENLVNLTILQIWNFSEMVYAISDEDDIAKTSGNNPQTIFHKLEWVELKRLPKLQSLCDWGWDVQFPSLNSLSIHDCPGMEGVTPESIRKQNMEAVQSRRLARQRVEEVD